MIQTYNIITNQASIINKLMLDNVYIQKIYSSSYYLSIALRTTGKTMYLYIGRGAGHEGIYLGEERVPSELRKIDKMLEYVRKHISGSSFSDISVDSDDRIISLNYQKWGHINNFAIFYKARKVYFLNYYFNPKSMQYELFRSWTNEKSDLSDFSFDLFDEVGRIKLGPIEDKAVVLPTVTQILKEEFKQAYEGSEKKKIKFLNRKLSRIEFDLVKVSQQDQLIKVIETETNLETLPRKNKVSDIKLNFKEQTHYKRRDEIYSKIKKLKKAEKILELRKEDTLVALEKALRNDIGENRLKTTSPVWIIPKEKRTIVEQKSSDKGYKIFHFLGYDIGVGSSARGNDLLRKEWAHKNDLWFHLEGEVSPHVILKLKSINLDVQLYPVIAGIMATFLKEKRSEVRLIFTMVKYLKGSKGAPGSVTYKNIKYITSECQHEWENFTI